MPQHYIAPFDFPDHEYNERLILGLPANRGHVVELASG